MKEKLIYIKKNWWKEPSLPWFVLTFIYTFFLATIVIVDFTSKIFLTSEALVSIYISFLTVYVLLKEYDRWIIKVRWAPRSGELFVLLWGIIALAMYATEYLTSRLYTTPPVVTNIVIGVIALFGFSKTIKHIFKQRQREDEEGAPPEQDRIYKNYSGPSKLIIH